MLAGNVNINGSDNYQIRLFLLYIFFIPPKYPSFFYTKTPLFIRFHYPRKQVFSGVLKINFQKLLKV